jgi:hypothetical protein
MQYGAMILALFGTALTAIFWLSDTRLKDRFEAIVKAPDDFLWILEQIAPHSSLGKAAGVTLAVVGFVWIALSKRNGKVEKPPAKAAVLENVDNHDNYKSNDTQGQVEIGAGSKIFAGRDGVATDGAKVKIDENSEIHAGRDGINTKRRE